jgi:hypothetical protein
VWDATTGKELLIVNHTGLVRRVAFSPDGTRLATASSDKTARVWDATTSQALLTVNHTGLVRGVAFSPDGTRLATASADETARVSEVPTSVTAGTPLAPPFKGMQPSPAPPRLPIPHKQRTAFVSCARRDRATVEELVRRLPRLGYQVWVDEALEGGQSWWNEILRQIATSDAFLAVVSPPSLNSVACQRERTYAHTLGKPILPVAVEKMSQAMPRELTLRQVVDYSAPSEEAAFALASALAGLPPAPRLPETMPPPPPLPTRPPPPRPPPPPPTPLPHLMDLHEQLAVPKLSKTQQHRILDALEPALWSTDADERRTGRKVLESLRARDDLFADTEKRILALMTAAEE